MVPKDVPRLTPGSKLYKCLEYDRVICEGKDETFLIEIKRLTDEHDRHRTDEDRSISLGPRAG